MHNKKIAYNYEFNKPQKIQRRRYLKSKKSILKKWNSQAKSRGISYAGNCKWFELIMLGYNLMNIFKEEVLNQKKVKEMLKTIRGKLFLIPGRFVFSGRKFILKLERTWLYIAEYKKALARVT